ncbi:MAG: ABC transporter ATP-binding protein [Alphaproteobacteria bacterium]
MSAVITVEGVSKRFGAEAAVEQASFAVAQGEFFALLGPSGCGKTTLLRMLAGFETPDAGRITIGGRDMTGVPPNRRPVNMVFQSYALFPHMTVAENVAYGLRAGGMNAADAAREATEALKLVRLEGMEERRPDMLSGGQRQRVALARALVKRPKVLLLDEPLSALDAKLRETMRLELVRLQETVGISFVFVTHDQDEALSMAGRIAVMEKGRIRQIADPRGLYETPNCRFVADFIGKANFFGGTVARQADGVAVVACEGLGPLAGRTNRPVSGAVTLMVRPERVRLSAEPPADGANLRGRVAHIAYYGDESRIVIDLGAGCAVTAAVANDGENGARWRAGGEVFLSWRPDDALILTD